MQNTDTGKSLSEFNRIFKENDEIYREVAKIIGLSDCAFWILYSLRDSKEVMTQSEICNTLFRPKQTVNSALKKLESEDFITLTGMSDRRSKRIDLTEKGKILAENTVDRVILAECKSFAGLTESEKEIFLGLFRKYTHLLRSNMKNLGHGE